MIYHRVKGCGGCYKPEQKRLGMMHKDEYGYECYGESYIKCFWDLCDHQKSVEAFTVKSDGAGKEAQNSSYSGVDGVDDNNNDVMDGDASACPINGDDAKATSFTACGMIESYGCNTSAKKNVLHPSFGKNN